MEIITGILIALGGGSGLVALWRAWSDHRNKVAAREEDAEERLVKRLEARAIESDKQIADLHRKLDDAQRRILQLSVALSGAGIAIPPAEDSK